MNCRVQMLAVLLTLLVPIVPRAQSTEPKLLDEFGKLNAEETEARFSQAMVHLASHPSSMLELVIHRGQNQSIGQPYRTFGIQKAYLLANKVARNRIIATFCEPRPTTETQMWLIGSLEQRHICTPDNPKLETSTLFISSSAPNPRYAFDGCCIVDELGDLGTMEAAGAFANFVNSHLGATAYIVVYGGTNLYSYTDSRGRSRMDRHLDPKSFVDKLSKKIRRRLLADDVDRARIISIAGGYRDEYASVDLWIIPPGGLRPKPTPNYFRGSKRRKTTRKRPKY
jgi:hypothetical protein